MPHVPTSDDASAPSTHTATSAFRRSEPTVTSNDAAVCPSV